jgi:hypothetical protein
MPYHVSRAGQTYGPYTLEDLRRYVSTGNVLLTDLAKSEEMTDWIPVAQILNPEPGSSNISGDTSAPAGGAYAAPYIPSTPYNPTGAYAGSAYPDAPNLHWGLVLLISIFTCGVFSVIWDFVQVLWMKRIEPGTKAFPYFIGYVVASFASGAFSAGASMMAHSGHHRGSALEGLIALASFVLMILYRFAMRDSLERHFNGAEPFGLRLGPIMTFFFGGLYFQYHINRINAIKQAAQYSGRI